MLIFTISLARIDRYRDRLLGADVIASMDALQVPKDILAEYDWVGRAARVAAALWPERCAGLVSVNSYLIQDIANASRPLRPATEAGF